MKENKTLESHSKTMPEHGGTRKEVVKSTMPEQTKAKQSMMLVQSVQKEQQVVSAVRSNQYY